MSNNKTTTLKNKVRCFLKGKRYSPLGVGGFLFFFFLPFVGHTQDTLLLEVVERTDSSLVNQLLQKADTTQSSAAVLQYLLKVQNYLEKENRPTSLFDIYTRIGKIYQTEGLDDRALGFYKKANQLPSPPILETQKINLLSPIAEAYFEMGFIDSALIVYDELLDYYDKTKNYEGTLKTLQQKVNVYLAIGNYRQALDFNLNIKLLAEERKDKKHLAIIYNNIGYNFNALKEYKKAIQYFVSALELRTTGYSTFNLSNMGSKETSDLDLTALYTNLAVAYNNSEEPDNAIKYLLEAQNSNDSTATNITDAYLQHLMASIYLNHSDVYNALKYNNSATSNAKKNKEDRVLSDSYLTAAKIQEELYDFELALDYYQKHLALRDSFALEDRFRKQQLLQQQLLLEKSEKEIRLLLINETIKDQEIAALQTEAELMTSRADRIKLEADRIQLEADRQQKAIELLQAEKATKDANLENTRLANEKAQQDLVIIRQKVIAQAKDRALEESKQKETLAQMEQKRANAEANEAKKEAELSKKNQDIAELELQQQKSFRQFAYGLGTLGLLLLLMILSGLYYSRIANRRLTSKNREIEEERRKSEKLLLNILPLETANELKTTGFATPKEYDKVTVLFADFSDFTKISEKLSAEELINELNDCFRAFDEITEQFGLEKIKTIGDGYMCAGGIPVANETNPTDSVKAAIAMQKYMKERYLKKTTKGLPYWNMRVGIHTGHVIAGVVGTKKFAYDIWGDTVNIASRMESACENGKINISSQTQELINGEFDCTYRGEVEVKHGNKVGMHFVSRSSNSD